MQSQADTSKGYSAKAYWEERLSEKWGLHGVGHISFGLPYNQWLYRVRRRVFRQNLRTLSVDLQKARVLDVGSGTGFWLREWESLGVFSISGLDITDIAVNRLQAQHPDKCIRQLDISEVGACREFSSEFELISAFEVLLHITDDAKFSQAISNIARLLHLNGYFIFSDNLVSADSIRRFHEVDRSLEDVTRLLEANGLRVVRKVPMFVIMNAPFDTRSRLPGYLWLLSMAPVHFVPMLGHLYGPVLYSAECLLNRWLKGSPSTEMVVCQKVGDWNT